MGNPTPRENDRNTGQNQDVGTDRNKDRAPQKDQQQGERQPRDNTVAR